MVSRWTKQLVALVFLGLGACAGGSASHFQVEIAFQHSAKLGGCAVGDLDARYPGNEIAAVSVTGEIFVLHREAGAWKSELVHKAAGEMLQCAIGEIDPSHEGLELLAVGMAKGGEEDGGEGAAVLLSHAKTGWTAETIFHDSALIHGCCVSPAGAVTVGFSGHAHLLTKTAGSWGSVRIGQLPGRGKTAVSTKHGVIAACGDGSLYQMTPPRDGDSDTGGGKWQGSVFDKREAGRARLGTDGERILSSDDDGALVLVSAGSKGGRIVHQEGKKLRGAVLADLDPRSPGLEAACVGYEGKLSIIYPEAKLPTRTVFQDTLKFHHLSSGDVGGSAFVELVACGYAGRVIVVSLDER